MEQHQPTDAGRGDTRPLIIVVDTSLEVRDALSRWLAVCLPPCRIAQATTGETALQAARDTAPSVVVIDINLPGMDGIAATRLIKASFPATHIIIFTFSGTQAHRGDAFAAGACAYTLKSRARHELLPLLRRRLKAETTVRTHDAEDRQQQPTQEA